MKVKTPYLSIILLTGYAEEPFSVFIVLALSLI